MFHLIEIVGKGAAAGGGEAVFSARDTRLEIFQAGNVFGLFEFAGMNAKVAVSRSKDALEVVEAEAWVGGEGAHDSETNALVDESVKFGELESAGGGNVLASRGFGFRRLAAVDEGSNHRASGR